MQSWRENPFPPPERRLGHHTSPSSAGDSFRKVEGAKVKAKKNRRAAAKKNLIPGGRGPRETLTAVATAGPPPGYNLSLAAAYPIQFNPPIVRRAGLFILRKKNRTSCSNLDVRGKFAYRSGKLLRAADKDVIAALDFKCRLEGSDQTRRYS
ncbi:hypothetical protein A3B36_02810 [Candidatus Uhrbacteria bacterium RIFCSPLOWO2_01_FULL_55_36]|uniref:Uncharacterized protein n=1 Tax=Candidatus Uhrbacteria bacterium RIFCSPLOWO2_01_FULL_55_36 TaxID=1802404 RepID=A0A1F7V2Y2_9BACT|nr:MAG: hypothetical protein A3B36_02810 [Candidatus Uhrbacteria bacterium RIFCSPLOWO2_01_FULL_55_36]